MAETVTSAHAKGIVGHLTKRFGTRVVGKDKAIMRIAGRIAHRRTGMSRQDFDERYITTLVNRIFAPFRVGDAGNEVWSPSTQVRILIHEHQHVVIRKRMGLLKYTRRYATPRGRAEIEAECYAAEFAWRWARTRWMPSAASQVSNLAAYGCSKEDIDVAEAMLMKWRADIQVGFKPQATHEAVKWCKQNAPELLTWQERL